MFLCYEPYYVTLYERLRDEHGFECNFAINNEIQ